MGFLNVHDLQKCFDFLLSCSQKNHSLSSYLELIYLCANLQKSGVLLLRDCSYNHSSVCSSDERAFQCLYCISIMFLTFSLFTQVYSRQNCVNHYSTCFYGKLGLSSITCVKKVDSISPKWIYLKGHKAKNRSIWVWLNTLFDINLITGNFTSPDWTQP